jgi:hypothetical protein
MEDGGSRQREKREKRASCVFLFKAHQLSFNR